MFLYSCTVRTVYVTQNSSSTSALLVFFCQRILKAADANLAVTGRCTWAGGSALSRHDDLTGHILRSHWLCWAELLSNRNRLRHVICPRSHVKRQCEHDKQAASSGSLCVLDQWGQISSRKSDVYLHGSSFSVGSGIMLLSSNHP